MTTDILSTQIYKYEKGNLDRLLIPLFASSIAAGFPSPADDYLELKLDLNELCIEHPSSTFLAWVQGDSMVNAGINPGDLLVIDRSLEATNNSIVVAILNSEFTVKRLQIKSDRYTLLPENSRYRPTLITEEMNFEVWGVVVSVVRMLSPSRGRYPSGTPRTLNINQ